MSARLGSARLSLCVWIVFLATTRNVFIQSYRECASKLFISLVAKTELKSESNRKHFFALWNWASRPVRTWNWRAASKSQISVEANKCHTKLCSNCSNPAVDWNVKCERKVCALPICRIKGFNNLKTMEIYVYDRQKTFFKVSPFPIFCFLFSVLYSAF